MSTETSSTIYTYLFYFAGQLPYPTFFIPEMDGFGDVEAWALLNAVVSNLPEGYNTLYLTKTVDDLTTYVSDYETSTFS